jgi:uncharacterized protein YndB with AHSA1/START domain
MDNDFEPTVGHRFTLRTDPGPGFDGIVHCEVLALDPPREMVWQWTGGPLDTQVRFSLEPDGEGARLTVHQTGFAGFKQNLVRLILQAGSKKIYGKLLPAVLDRMDEEGALLPAEAMETNCEKGGLWAWLARIFSPILGRTPKHG